MPSPIGHALGAVAAGFAASRSTPAGARTPYPWREAALFATVGLLPDLDLAFGLHSQYTHSVGAVAAAFGVAWLATRRRNLRLAAAAALAYASHPLLDWLGQDGTPPYGVMLLWPFDAGYYHSGLDVFTGISRRYWLPGFLAHNVAAVAWEVVLLGPLAVAAWWVRRRRAERATG
jgi:membrane-bound metal-dependent hydrolase YbcI (DUF457 family)